MYCNSRSVHNKVEELINRVSLINPDVVAVTETWGPGLKLDGFSDPFVDSRMIRGGRNGGGVAIFVRSGLLACGMKGMNDDLECCWCNIYCDKDVILTIGCFYRSTNARIFDIDSRDNAILMEIAKIDTFQNPVIVMGDFNAGNINWCFLECDSHNNSFDGRLLDVVQDNFVAQHVLKPTRYANNGISRSLLDLIFTRSVDAQFVSDIVHSDPIGQSDHEVLTFYYIIPVSTAICDDASFSTHDFSRANFDHMSMLFQNADWSGGSDDCSPNHLWNVFERTYNDAINQYVPMRNIRKSKHPWVSKSTIRALKNKDRCYRTTRNSGAAIDKII